MLTRYPICISHQDYLFTIECTPGQVYNMPDNPCMDCMCGEDGRPTGDCNERMCSIFQCPEGQWAKHIDGTCCGFECVDRREFVLDCYPIFRVYHTIGSLGNFKYGIMGSQLDSLPYA